MKNIDLSFKGKNVFVTGHTGFKGSWLCKLLPILGANVTGYALKPDIQPNLFDILKLSGSINSVYGDVTDYEHLKSAMLAAKPDIVIHMAAQAIVLESFKNPVQTYNTNVMGTVNVMEAVRYCKSVKSVVNVTTDKVYENKQWHWGYRENDILNGYDPYSNSKSCSELITDSYRKCFFGESGVAVSTCRAGNVIGGGDFAADRIIPDCVRAIQSGTPLILRNPCSTRPFQHVLEPLFAYLLLAAMQYENPEYMGSYNVGPNDIDCITTGELVNLFKKSWGGGLSVTIQGNQKNGLHEAAFLKLDCSKIKNTLGWTPRWNIETAIEKTIEWTKIYFDNQSDIEVISKIMERQIAQYLENN